MNKFTPLHLLLILILITVVAFIGIYSYFNKVTSTGMPSLSKLEDPDQELSTRIMSADGTLIGTFYSDQRRIRVPYDSIPKHFVNALIASEDRKFYDHWGPDPDRIIKAIIKRIFMGQVSGASTITQQVARNLFLNQDRILDRKIREVVTAVKIEQIYTKEQILEMYANTVLFGRGCFGLGVAAKHYFDKEPMELTLGESAMLVGILPRPSGYNPFHDYQAALHRRNIVLNAMVKTGVITEAEAAEAKAEEPALNFGDIAKKMPSTKIGDNIAPHFLEMIRQEFSTPEMLARFNIYRDGMKIKTTLNTDIQKYALEAVEQHIGELQELFDKRFRWNSNDEMIAGVIQKCIVTHNKYRSAKTSAEKKRVAKELRSSKAFMDSVKNVATTVQCGLTVIDAKTGGILAMVGASPKSMRESFAADYSLNHVTQIKRQPGSSMKPFVYAASLTNGYTPESMMECGPFRYMLFDSSYWEPRGTGSCEEGDSRSLESALQWSINTVSARLITSATNPEEVIHICRKAGIKSQLDPYPALSLGAGGDIRPMELASSFQIFLNNGLHRTTYCYNYVEDNLGNEIEDLAPQQKINEAIRPEISTQMLYMMEKVVNGGTAHRIRDYFKGIDAAGKTGTTDEAADAWFTGFTPELICGIWVGFDDKRITFDCLGSKGYGGHAAAPVWGILMDKIYKDKNLPYGKKQFDYKSHEYDSGKPYPLTKTQKSFIPPPPEPDEEMSEEEILLEETFTEPPEETEAD